MPTWDRAYFGELSTRFNTLASGLRDPIGAVGPGRVAPSIDDLAIGSGRELRGAALFFDIRGFTSRTASAEPADLRSTFHERAQEAMRCYGAQPAEVLARSLLERAIVVKYLGALPGAEAYERFKATCDGSIIEKWPGETELKVDPSTKVLPNYFDMSSKIDQSGDFYKAYRQLSHIAHPRSSMPYIVSEFTRCGKTGMPKIDFFHERAGAAFNATCIVFRSIIDVCEKELG